VGKNKKVFRITKNHLIFLLIISSPLFSIEKEKSFYTIQVITLPEKSLNRAIEISKEIEKEEIKDVRVEKIGKNLVVRAGIFTDKTEAKKVLRKIKKNFPQAFLRKGYYIEKRIIYPFKKPPPAEKELPEKPFPSEKKIVKKVPSEETISLKKSKMFKYRKPLFVFSFVLFWFLLLIPFIPAIVEIKKPRDNKPITINMEYTKNPRYFDISFRNILLNALKETKLLPSIYNVKLSKEEKVEISESKDIKSYEEINHILFVKGDLTSGEKVVFNKEIYVKGKAKIGRNNLLRAITSEGDIILSDEVKIVRWIGSDENIYTGNNCNLGILAGAEKTIKISGKCNFKRLYGNPIIIEKTGEKMKEEKESRKLLEKKRKKEKRKYGTEISDTSMVFNKKWATIPPEAKIEKDIIAKSSLLIREKAKIYGSIKVYGKLIIEKDVLIDGNVFGESEIEIGENCVITGDVFSQESIHLKNGTIIGKKGQIKSLIARDKLKIEKNAVIHGYVLVENEGTVL